jgi:DNA end-binding protein Ku
MPRSIWNGTITFGLIAVPIKVHSATEDRSVHFHQVHDKDGARIRHKRICSKEGKEVPYEEVAKGYEVRPDEARGARSGEAGRRARAWRAGEYVMLSQDEIDAAAGTRSKLIELEEFVCAEHVDPVFYNRGYYLGAGDGGEDAYRLLHDALSRSARAGLGRWVFHNREYLVAVRPVNGTLALHTMRFADELVDAGELEVAEPSRKPSKREVEMAGQLVESLHERFKPSAFKDSYRERLLAMIERKAKGEEIELPAAEEPRQDDDLLAALEASLGGNGKGGAKGGGKKAGKR